MSSPAFPVFRKYKNNTSWFKIISETQFEEVKKMPSGYVRFHFDARIMPDRNYIHDMLFDYRLYWDECSEEEFDDKRAQAG